MLLLDSASLYYRAFFALPESIVAPDGQPVNAVRGFLETVAAMVRERGAVPIVACWDDDWRPQWRVNLVPTYKTHRLLDDSTDVEETPDTLSPQISILRELLPALGIPIAGGEHAEADDVIAYLSHAVVDPVDIASGDRDLVQLVSDRVTLLYTGGSSASRKGRPWDVITPIAALERFGVRPEHYADLAVLRGDPSDGLPGVRGIGDKTAAALISAFGGLPGILAAANDPESPRPMTPAIRQRLLGARDEIAAAERVVRLGSADHASTIDTAAWLGVTTAGTTPRDDALELAATYGVSASAKRLLEAFT